MDRRTEFAARPPRRAAPQPYRKTAGAIAARLRHRHRDRRPSGDARLARQRARPPRRGARRRAFWPDRHHLRPLSPPRHRRQRHHRRNGSPHRRRPGAAPQDGGVVIFVVPANAATSSSPRKQGPIGRGGCCLGRWPTAGLITTAGGYGSLLSQGRRPNSPSCFRHRPDLISGIRRNAASRIWRVQFAWLSCKDACRTLPFPFIRPEIKRFPMVNRMQFYIDGAWVDPAVKKSTPVVNPATEEAMYEVALGSKADVDKAVAAARRAFLTYSQTSREERIALFEKIIEIYKTRMKDIGAAVSDEMGAPLPMAEKLQAGAGLGHIASTLEVLKNYHFEENVGTAVVLREPVGVVGMITPWNWPLNQIACKVAPALAAGCTMILKPSEFTPSSALIFAEILHEAGVPKGVFNLINGLGPEVGAAMSEHPDIDMISFTGSTRAGIDVAKRAAPTE